MTIRRKVIPLWGLRDHAQTCAICWNGPVAAMIHRSHDVRVDDPATDRNCFSTMFGYSGLHGDPA
jgi:hypothetical protein